MATQQKWGWPVWIGVIAGAFLAFRYEHLWLTPLLYWVRGQVEAVVRFLFD